MKTDIRTSLVLAASLLAAGCQGEGGQADGGNAAASDNRASTPGASPAAGKTAETGTLAQAIGGSQDLSSFAGAMKGAGLDGTLSGAVPYTIFAPNNAAFGKLQGGDAQSKGRMTALLTYHIVPGVVTAKDLQAAIRKGGGKAEVATMGGANLTASLDGDEVVLSDAQGGRARVVRADRMNSNGVVHVVDAVLMPQ
jgi:uncharacterized surface protein with fasciclin (FAS1) repeats